MEQNIKKICAEVYTPAWSGLDLNQCAKGTGGHLKDSVGKVLSFCDCILLRGYGIIFFKSNSLKEKECLYNGRRIKEPGSLGKFRRDI